MKVYVVSTGEFTNCADESSFGVDGVFSTRKEAVSRKNYLRDVSLIDFKNEYIKFENDSIVVIKNKDENDYRYEIKMLEIDICDNKN